MKRNYKLLALILALCLCLPIFAACDNDESERDNADEPSVVTTEETTAAQKAETEKRTETETTSIGDDSTSGELAETETKSEDKSETETETVSEIVFQPNEESSEESSPLTPPEGYLYTDIFDLSVVYPDTWSEINDGVYMNDMGESIFIMEFNDPATVEHYKGMTVEKLAGFFKDAGYTDFSVAYILPEYSDYEIARCYMRDDQDPVQQTLIIIIKDDYMITITVTTTTSPHTALADAVIDYLVIKPME